MGTRPRSAGNGETRPGSSPSESIFAPLLNRPVLPPSLQLEGIGLEHSCPSMAAREGLVRSFERGGCPRVIVATVAALTTLAPAIPAITTIHPVATGCQAPR